MAKKSDIISNLVTNLKNVGGFTNVFPHFKFIDQINDFPTICIHIAEDDRNHLESTTLGGDLIVSIRGYVYKEDSIGACDTLIQDIETVISQISYPGYQEDIRVISVDSDEGLYEPHGIVDMRLSIMY